MGVRVSVGEWDYKYRYIVLMPRTRQSNQLHLPSVPEILIPQRERQTDRHTEKEREIDRQAKRD